MKDYSVENKKRKKAWVQTHKNDEGASFFKIHYIEYDTEYSTGMYLTHEAAKKDLVNF